MINRLESARIKERNLRIMPKTLEGISKFTNIKYQDFLKRVLHIGEYEGSEWVGYMDSAYMSGISYEEGYLVLKEFTDGLEELPSQVRCWEDQIGLWRPGGEVQARDKRLKDKKLKDKKLKDEKLKDEIKQFKESDQLPEDYINLFIAVKKSADRGLYWKTIEEIFAEVWMK